MMAISFSPPLLMASKTRILAIPNRTPLSPPTPTSLSLLRRTTSLISKPPTLSLSLLRPKSNLLSAAASSSPPPPPIPAQNPTHHSPLTGSTRTITTIFSIALSISKLLALNLVGGIFNTPPTATGPLFFAAIGQGADPRSAGAPIAVIAAGLARWLEIYSCVLLIRVLLSWFPNMPWEKQPLSAVRDLCDPYLSLFRGIIPPLFNSLDVSPILAFLLLGMLGQFARAPRP
ncbi:ylmG homolog protein 1-2, chloroplastic-like [Rhododendron vialii]|uniref:ylmG homolog protein 1-2, chloroplastic-like n=1 Tax=Rhododendron vialii TaxID=182163 RepID=UPI00266017B9|nr:ylmG homolog protein 1-2, chloroplastic-like [Rhododendron vialii]